MLVARAKVQQRSVAPLKKMSVESTKSSDTSEVNYFIFVANEAHLPSGARCSASVIARSRLAQKRWCIYETTRHKKLLKSGDKVVIYIAGQLAERQQFIACAEIASIKPSIRYKTSDEVEQMDQDSSLTVKFSSIKFLKPVGIKEIGEKLSFFPTDNPKWGATMMGGCKLITSKDFQEIVKQ